MKKHERIPDPVEFRNGLMVDTAAGPKLFKEVCEPWQEADFAALDNGWRAVVGLPVKDDRPIYRRAYLERPKGHSKTSDIALQALYALTCSRRPLCGYAAAVDQEQARLQRDAVERLVRLNAWLKDLIVVDKHRIKNVATGSTLDVISNDAASSHGLLPDFVLVDELTHWTKPDLWDSLLAGAAKRSTCLLTVISNAGQGQGSSWQWRVREHARTSPQWHFGRLDGPRASWISEADLAEQRDLLPPKVFARLWLNLWSSGVGDCLDMGDVENCCTLKGPHPGPLTDFFYFGALDLGVKNDHSAIVVLGVDVRTPRVHLAECQSWAPPYPGGQVNLMEVQHQIERLHKKFYLHSIVYDPWQAMLLAQQLAGVGLRMIEHNFSGANLDLMATTLIRTIRNRRVALYRDPGLLADLSRLSIVEKSYGFRLEAPRGPDGHCDRATALAMALPYAEIEIECQRRGENEPIPEQYLVA